MTDLESKAEIEELSEPVTIGVEAYISEDYARAERDKLWRKVWQQVGRVEEIPEVGQLPDLRHPRRLDHRRAHGPKRIQGPPQRVHAPRPPAGRHPGRREERLRPGTQVVRLRLPRLDVRPRRRVHPHPRTGRLAGRADAGEHPSRAGQASTPGVAGCSINMDPDCEPLARLSRSRPRRSSTRSDWRTCATSGANG